MAGIVYAGLEDVAVAVACGEAVHASQGVCRQLVVPADFRDWRAPKLPIDARRASVRPADGKVARSVRHLLLAVHHIDLDLRPVFRSLAADLVRVCHAPLDKLLLLLVHPVTCLLAVDCACHLAVQSRALDCLRR